MNDIPLVVIGTLELGYFKNIQDLDYMLDWEEKHLIAFGKSFFNNRLEDLKKVLDWHNQNRFMKSSTDEEMKVALERITIKVEEKFKNLTLVKKSSI